MTQLSAKNREKRRNRYMLMQIELRLLGAPAYVRSQFTHSTPNSHNLRMLAETIVMFRKSP